MRNRTVTVHYYAGLEGWNAKLRRDGVHVTIGSPHPTGQDAFRLGLFLALVADGADREMLRDALDDWGKNPAAAVAEAEAILRISAAGGAADHDQERKEDKG
jgi:hypothetical protein